MISKDILDEVSKQGGLTRVKSPLEINQEGIKKDIGAILEHNRYIEDAIARIKEQITKGKEYKFVLNRDKDGLIKEVIAVPVTADLIGG